MAKVTVWVLPPLSAVAEAPPDPPDTVNRSLAVNDKAPDPLEKPTPVAPMPVTEVAAPSVTLCEVPPTRPAPSALPLVLVTVSVSPRFTVSVPLAPPMKMP